MIELSLAGIAGALIYGVVDRFIVRPAISAWKQRKYMRAMRALFSSWCEDEMKRWGYA
jgi:hypothetical protein